MLRRLTLIAQGATPTLRAMRFADDAGLEPGAAEAARALTLRVPARVLSGPSRASQETAAALALVPEIDPALSDLDVGRWAGLGVEDLAAREPQNVAAWTTDLNARPHGGETLAELVHRMGRWLEEQLDVRSTLVIAPPLVVRAAVVAALDAPADALFRVDVPPLGRVMLVGDGRRWNLRELRAD